jgi:hypothetical protein
MKYTLSLLVAICFSLFAVAAGSKISFASETHDFGSVKRGPDAVYYFEFTNTGDQPLIIGKCSGSCSCTKATCPTQPIMPGAKGKIEVHFEKKDKEGAFNKSVFIKCNASNVDPNKGAYEIYIKGNVLVKGKKAKR